MPQHDVPVRRTDDVATPVAVQPVADPTCGSWCARPHETYFGSAPSLITATRAEIVDVPVAIVAEDRAEFLGHRLHSVYIKAASGERTSQQEPNTELGCVGGGRSGPTGAAGSTRRSGVKPRTFRLPDQPEVVARRLGTANV